MRLAAPACEWGAPAASRRVTTNCPAGLPPAQHLPTPSCPSPAPCSFLELSSGFSLLFSLLLAIGAAVAARHRTPLDADVASVAAFAGLWWLVAAITATQRGQQASDAGLAQRSARDAVIALSWLEFVLFVAAYAVTAYER